MIGFHLRRKDKEITDSDTLKKILSSTAYVTIAMCKHGQPYLVSLSHGYDGESNSIYFHCSTEGKKIDYLLKSNRVWGQALLDYGSKCTENGCTHLYASIHFYGKVTFLEDVKDKRHAIDCMIRQLGGGSEQLVGKLDYERLNKTMIGRIDIEYMTGKKTQEVTV